MNQELQLKLQAYLDGELSRRQAGEVAAWLAQDPAAQALASELRLTREVLHDNQPQYTLPESGEFYWSKIQREVLKEQPVSLPAALCLWWWLRRYLAPLAGVGIVAFLAIAVGRFSAPTEPHPYLAEVENLSEHVGSYSFRSQKGKMVVVWLYDRGRNLSSESEAAEEEWMFQ